MGLKIREMKQKEKELGEMKLEIAEIAEIYNLKQMQGYESAILDVELFIKTYSYLKSLNFDILYD